MNVLKRFAVTLSFVSLIFCSKAQAQDWAAFRGSDGYGSATPGGLLSRGGEFELRVGWKRSLGSGYSSVVVAGDRLVTMFTDGENDLLVCLEKSTGETIWQTPTGPSYPGENGSFDGPITTPLVYQGRVYSLDPAGVFFCLDLDDGNIVWKKDLTSDLGSTKPMYGFATSPIVAGDTLVVQTGAPEKALAGMNPETGEVLWEVSDDRINSQSPVTINFHGTEIVLAAGGKLLTGVDPANGNVLFEHEHGGRNASSVVPVPVSSYRVVLTLDDAYSRAFSLRPGDEDQIEVSEEWENRSIRNTYNVPALSGGNLFAYSTRILTCVDPDSGQPRWKSRAPGDGFLIAIDKHLIINTKQGSLHIARASDDSYQECAAIELFDDLCWSLPAYSDNSIFVRSLGEIARVDIVPANQRTMADSDPVMAVGPRFQELQDQLAEAGDSTERNELVHSWLDEQDSLPFIDGNLVHFVFHGDHQDVAVASDLFGARQERKMTRIPDTNLFYYTMELEPDQRANYMFLVDYTPQTDPGNQRNTTSSVYAGEMEFAVRLEDEQPLDLSWFAMSGWEEPEYLKDLPEELSGSMVRHHVESESNEKGMDIDVYLPPGYDADETRRFRTIYLLGGPAMFSVGKLDKVVDKIMTSDQWQVEPAILVNLSAPMGSDPLAAIVTELIPSIDASFRTRADRQSRTCAGFGFFSGTAIGLAGQHSDLFENVAAYSPLVFDAQLAAASTAIGEIELPTRVYLEWGRFDMFNPHENWDIHRVGEKLYEICQHNPAVTLSGGMVNDSTDWASWRNRFLALLEIGSQ